MAGVKTRYVVINFVQALFLIVWSMIWMTAAVVASVFSSELPLVMARHCWSPPLLFFSGVTLELEGLERLPKDQPFVFAMNHQSMIDVPVALAAIPRNLRFICKRSLLWVPFLGWYIWRVGYVAIDRSQRDKAYEKIREAASVLEKGRSVLVYPEGTRSNDGTVKKFKRGPFVLAQAARAAVVPVAIDGAGDVLPSGTFRLRPGTIRLSFGTPISTHEVTEDPDAIDGLRTEVQGAVSALLLDLRKRPRGRERDLDLERHPALDGVDG